MCVNVEVSPVLKDAGIDTVCILRVPRNSTHEHLLCVQCEAQGKLLPQSAGNILSDMLTDETGRRHAITEDEQDRGLEQTLRDFRGAEAEWTNCTLAAIGGGEYGGFRAVGVGGKKVPRQRATKISLAATAIYWTYGQTERFADLSPFERKDEIADAARKVAGWQTAEVRELLIGLVEAVDEALRRYNAGLADAAASASSGAATEQRQM